MSSIREVARQAGVSPATVSRTFTTPTLINEHTQRRVLEAAEHLNYRPRTARLPRTRTDSHPAKPAPASRGAVGFQFFSAFPGDSLATNAFYAPVLAGAQSEAAALGLHLLVHTTDRHSLSTELPRMVEERAIDGMLLVGTAESAILESFAQHVPHIILVDNRDASGQHESIVSDGFGGAYAATRYLLELGHRRIAFFTGEPNVPTFRDRARGWMSALFESGVTPDRALLLPGTLDEWEQAAQLRAFLTSADRPTALMAANDDYAFLVLRLCRELGLRVPDDLSVTGFDDSAFSRETDPPLTTVRVEKEVMGRLAVRRLHARLRAEHEGITAGPEPPVCHEIPVSLVMRGSCKSL